MNTRFISGSIGVAVVFGAFLTATTAAAQVVVAGSEQPKETVQRTLDDAVRRAV